MFGHRCVTRGHRKVGGSWTRYTVYDNRTDELVILDGTARECARAMKLTLGSFQSAVTHARTGKVKRWHIERCFSDEMDPELLPGNGEEV